MEDARIWMERLGGSARPPHGRSTLLPLQTKRTCTLFSNKQGLFLE